MVCQRRKGLSIEVGFHRHDDISCLPCFGCMTLFVVCKRKISERWRLKIESNAAEKVHALGK